MRSLLVDQERIMPVCDPPQFESPYPSCFEMVGWWQEGHPTFIKSVPLIPKRFLLVHSGTSGRKIEEDQLSQVHLEMTVKTEVDSCVHKRMPCVHMHIITPYHSTVYVDAAFCCRPSSVVCQSVCLSQ